MCQSGKGPLRERASGQANTKYFYYFLLYFFMKVLLFLAGRLLEVHFLQADRGREKRQESAGRHCGHRIHLHDTRSG